MLQLILGGVGLTIWALYIIITYYSKNYSTVNHMETASGFGGYLLTLLVIYGVYKLYTVLFSGKKQIKFTFLSIFGFSLLSFFILCVTYASFPSVTQSPLMGNMQASGLALFLHAIRLLIYPVLLTFLVRAVGSTIIRLFIRDWTQEKLRLQVLADISIGFLVFVIGLLILGASGYYNLNGLITLVVLLTAIAIPGLISTYHDIKCAHITYDNHQGNGTLLELLSPKLLSAEIAFLVINFLVGVSLINAIRPMPIGWDDLGVYMNFPKIMAMTGEYLLGAGMYSWQLITGTGFFFSYTAAQAFYVNQLGGILAVIAITSALSLILEDSKKKYLLSLPILFAAVFYAMPMNIFQQAKDMKLDPALLAISISGILMLFSGWKATIASKRDMFLLALAGVIIGFAFSVKFTSLMLVIGGFALIAYRILSLSGFLGFFFLFLGIFTKAGFWGQLNVWMPTDARIINIATIVLVSISLISFIIAWKQSSGKQVQYWFVSSLVFLVGIVVGFSPWIVKNVSEVKPWAVSQSSDKKALILASVLNGSGGTLGVDFTKIYSKEEYMNRTKKLEEAGMTGSGKSQNEDMGRYFGYDSGINNYLKLPANLTFQKNQAGEFTEISYFFLAFFPAMLLFVRGRRGIYATGIGVALVFLFLYFFVPTFGGDFFSSILSFSSASIDAIFGAGNNLLFGYITLIAINIAFIAFSHCFIDDKHDENKKLKEMIILFGSYGFVFLVSAFGIVWYGILIYFILFALVGLASSSFLAYEDDELKEENSDAFGVKATLTAIFFILVSVYFLRSALPHGWNNFKDASYNEFKFNVLTQEESILAYRQDYITPISTLNVRDPNALIERVKKLATTEKLKAFLTSDRIQGISMKDFVTILISLSRNSDVSIANDARKVGDTLYKGILYPSREDTNTGGIYRIGTFMTYLINQNRERYFDDSLVFSFDSYFYDQDPELTIDRMKKMGLKYLLVDLNAATIDKDPRHALTTRFEHLLHTMKARNLTLVDTDNICLQLALDEYKKGKLQDENSFIDIAGTNYESYRGNGSGQVSMLYRGQKQQTCYNYILKRLYIEGASSEYPYLAPIKTAIDDAGAIASNGSINQEKLMNILNQYAGQSWFALFEISDTPVNTPPIVVTPVTATGTTSSGAMTGTGTIQ